MKAVFLDRDGIINREIDGYVWSKEQFEFTSGIFDFLRSCRKSGYELIVITNQGGIDKSLYTCDDVNSLHAWMIKELRDQSIELLDIYFCPHHDEYQKCLCRKPLSLLLQKAIAIHGIDTKASFMIGDRERDVIAAKGAGIRGILMESNPDWHSINLSSLLK